VKPGLVDWPAVQARHHEQGIVLVGRGADEAPEVYKRLPNVPRRARGLHPGEASAPPARCRMAGRDVYDPYKD
jgi:tRNA-splicing ligase RtcB